ncbi:MAG: hypothetical protein LBQ47_07395 [Endomicrobium sp.]|jgi:hypothetical protein|nr:hypothetical protein [Endomicrobium sp.]
MKRLFFAAVCLLFLYSYSFCAREFLETRDYFVDFSQNDESMAAVLRINFINIEPTPEEAEHLLKDQLQIYGKIIDDEEAAKKKEENEAKAKDKTAAKTKPALKDLPQTPEEEEEEKFKNIIGSVWFSPDGNPENLTKIKYNDYLASFVRIGKTKKIVPFPDYITFLKKERDDKKAKEKAKSQEEALAKQMTIVTPEL